MTSPDLSFPWDFMKNYFSQLLLTLLLLQLTYDYCNVNKTNSNGRFFSPKIKEKGKQMREIGQVIDYSD